tara:strand:- start:131 stop:493 length:363 start_codon:yes stop_codon:yes gene_type:complete
MKKLICHCKSIEIEIDVSKPFKKILKCNCSLCKKRGAIMAMVGPDDLKIVKGKEFLKLYQFHTKVAKHYFCSNCGVYTHHNPRANPNIYGINLACLEDFDIFTLKEVAVNDGENHPLDKK